MAALEGLTDYVREKVEKDRMTHGQLSIHLQEIYPGVRGFSVRSLERFCSQNSIHRTARPSDQQLDEAVSDAIEQVRMLVMGSGNHTLTLFIRGVLLMLVVKRVWLSRTVHVVASHTSKYRDCRLAHRPFRDLS